VEKIKGILMDLQIDDGGLENVVHATTKKKHSSVHICFSLWDI
jgi:hypothetical protein